MDKNERENLQNNPPLYCKYLLDTYKFRITPGRKSGSEMIVFLETKYDAIRCDIEEIDEFYFWTCQVNALHAEGNEQLKLKKEELDFVAFRIPRNEKNEMYYKQLIKKNMLSSQGFIPVLLEIKTGYITSLSNLIFLEAVIAQGISEADYENETNNFFSYCFFMDEYFEGEAKVWLL